MPRCGSSHAPCSCPKQRWHSHTSYHMLGSCSQPGHLAQRHHSVTISPRTSGHPKSKHPVTSCSDSDSERPKFPASETSELTMQMATQTRPAMASTTTDVSCRVHNLCPRLSKYVQVSWSLSWHSWRRKGHSVTWAWGINSHQVKSIHQSGPATCQPDKPYNHLQSTYIPVVPHKAVAEVSKIGNL